MKIWFIQRSDGKMFSMNERQAYEALQNRMVNSKFSIYGVGEGRMWSFDGDPQSMSPCGEVYIAHMEAGKATLPAAESVDALKAKMKQYEDAVNELLFKEMLDEKDPRVVRGNERIMELFDKIQNAGGERKGAYKKLHEEAMVAQLEAVKGNIIHPSKYAASVFNPANNPKVEQAMRNRM